jgi:hypothetical protein
MKKKVKQIITLAAFTAMAVAAIFYTINHNQNTNDKTSSVRPIVCFGDSLTEGVGADGTDYPSLLKDMICSYADKDIADGIKVYNEGNSGESSISIAARSSGVKMLTAEAMSFSAFSAKAQVVLEAEDGRLIEPWHDAKYSTKVSVGDVSGRLIFDEKKYSYYFIRDNFIGSQYIPKGTEITVEKNSLYENAVTIVFIGQNGGYETIDDLIYQQKAIIPQDIYDSGLYIILGLTSGTALERAPLEEAMEKEYGRNYINLREIMSGERVLEFVSELSDEDVLEMQEGVVPQCLRAENDMVHLNRAGYSMIARMIFERMLELDIYGQLIM